MSRDVVRSSEYNVYNPQLYQETSTAIEALVASRPLINSLPNMSTILAQSNAIFIDLEADLLPLLDSIPNLTVDPPSLYIDLEGIDLGRMAQYRFSPSISLPLERLTSSTSIPSGGPPSRPPIIVEPRWKLSWNLQSSLKSFSISVTSQMPCSVFFRFLLTVLKIFSS